MLGRKRWQSIAFIAALAVGGLASTAGADASSEAGFLAKINASRAAAGLGAVKMESGLQSWARQHTQFMIDGGCADGQAICHSTSAQLQAAGGSGWSKLGENVGRGGSVDSLHKAFMESDGHRRNILDKDFNYVGIGTATSGDGRLYVTVVFMAKGSSSSSQPPATTTPKPATTTPKPTTTTTTTTLPPTTTTTLIVGPDKAVTPGESCPSVTRLWWTCHD